MKILEIIAYCCDRFSTNLVKANIFKTDNYLIQWIERGSMEAGESDLVPGGRSVGEPPRSRRTASQARGALMRSSGGEERRLATSAEPGTLALKKAALDQDEGGKGPRGGWRSRGAGCTERDRRPLSRRG